MKQDSVIQLNWWEDEHNYSVRMFFGVEGVKIQLIVRLFICTRGDVVPLMINFRHISMWGVDCACLRRLANRSYTDWLRTILVFTGAGRAATYLHVLRTGPELGKGIVSIQMRCFNRT